MPTVNLQFLYKLKTAKLFEKPKNNVIPSSSSTTNPQSTKDANSQSSQTTNGGPNGETDDLFAIDYIVFNAEKRALCVAGITSHVIVFNFNKHDAYSEVGVSVAGLLAFSQFKL